MLKGDYIFNNPFFPKINFTVGSNFVSIPDYSTRFPAILVIDYIWVYKSGKEGKLY